MSNFIKTAVIGHPIGHSLSPRIHNYWIETYKLNGLYEALDIKPEHLSKRLPELLRAGYQGFNLTVPHKEMVLPLCDEIDDKARAVGAVNTIWTEDARIKGTNTDIFGFVQNIKSGAPEFDFTAGPAVVLGAGGAARAVVQGLLQEGAPEIVLLNRTRARAEALAESFADARITVRDWAKRDEFPATTNLLVNTTSLGMSGAPPLEISLGSLPRTALVTDIVYAPLETKLLREANDSGHKTVNGLGMLLHQARPAFEKWHGIMPEIDETLIQEILK